MFYKHDTRVTRIHLYVYAGTTGLFWIEENMNIKKKKKGGEGIIIKYRVLF